MKYTDMVNNATYKSGYVKPDKKARDLSPMQEFDVWDSQYREEQRRLREQEDKDPHKAMLNRFSDESEAIDEQMKSLERKNKILEKEAMSPLDICLIIRKFEREKEFYDKWFDKKISESESQLSEFANQALILIEQDKLDKKKPRNGDFRDRNRIIELALDGVQRVRNTQDEMTIREYIAETGYTYKDSKTNTIIAGEAEQYFDYGRKLSDLTLQAIENYMKKKGE